VLRYAQGVDDRDWDAVRSCFDPDGQMVGTFGAAPSRQYLPGLIERVERFGATMHMMGNQLRAISGDVARTETYGIAYHFADAKGTREELVVGMRYDDELVRQPDGSWLITTRKARTIWTREGTTTP
jgi:hypothetical protein